MPTQYIFFTGGVVSSVGKGVTAAAIGRLLKSVGSKWQFKSWIHTLMLILEP